MALDLLHPVLQRAFMPNSPKDLEETKARPPFGSRASCLSLWPDSSEFRLLASNHKSLQIS